jgi:hypothetical protein
MRRRSIMSWARKPLVPVVARSPEEAEMNSRLGYAGLLSAALMASVALAQSASGADQNAAPQAAQPQAQAGAAAPKGGDIVTQQAQDEWRASKLIGVGVYDPENKKIGAIKEVMMGHDGSAKSVVIGIGGFLGMGTKDIAVPFSALQWKTESRQVPAGNAATGSVGSTGSTGSTGGGKPPTQTVDSGAIEAHQGYPDKAMLSMTLAQLQAAPDFHFAPDPTDQSQQASQGAEQRTQPKSNP